MKIINELYNEVINKEIDINAFFNMLINRCIYKNYLISINNIIYEPKYLDTESLVNTIIDENDNTILSYHFIIDIREFFNTNKIIIITDYKEL